MNPFIEVARDYAWIPNGIDVVGETMAQDAGHDWGHLARVLSHAYDIAKTTPVDEEVVTAAVLFHDVINLAKNAPDRHLASRHSAELAVTHFPFFSDQQREQLFDAILCHSFSAKQEPSTNEARVVQDADNLESLGALGIARVFYICGKIDSELFSAEDPFAESRELDDRKFALDHFYRKVLKLPAMMQTERGREKATQYSGIIEQFLVQLRAELEVGRPS